MPSPEIDVRCPLCHARLVTTAPGLALRSLGTEAGALLLLCLPANELADLASGGRAAAV